MKDVRYQLAEKYYYNPIEKWEKTVRGSALKYNHKQTISTKRCSISPVTTEVVLKGQLGSIYQNLFVLMRTMPILRTYPAERPAKGIYA